HATLTPEIKTYDEANPKAKSVAAYQNTNTTINQSSSNTHTVSGTGNTLVIESSGTIQVSNSQAVNFTKDSSTTTFLNQGTLISGNNTASVQIGANNQNGATIETFDNQGIIGNGSSKFGITVWGKSDNKSTINNFTNSGTIHSNAGESIYFSNVNISSFVNSGTISGNSGVNIANGTSIENFINSGAIISSNGSGWRPSGLKVSGATIQNLQNSGSIINTSSGVALGVQISGASIDKLSNSGAISGIVGVYVENSNIKTLENSGIIEATSKESWSAGIKLENGGTIEDIINTGTIKSNTYGIVLYGGNFGTLTLKDGGIISSKESGITVYDRQTLGDLYIDGTSSKKDGTVSGIYSEKSGIYLTTGSKTNKIELINGGIIKGKVHGIMLEGGASLSGEMILSGEGSRVEGGRGAGISNS
ncbi:hypothetical protein ACI3V6_001786, partial [Campylobacter jejuni]